MVSTALPLNSTDTNVSRLNFSPFDTRAGREVSSPFLDRLPVERFQANNRAEIPIPSSYNVLLRTRLLVGQPIRFRVPSLTLRVSDADQDGVLVVTDTFSRVYGEGVHDIVAINDYFSNLHSHFLWLEQHEDILAPGLQRDLAEMRRYVART
jgi:hypothetical protein